MLKRVIAAFSVALLVGAAVETQQPQPFQPSVPLLELKRDEDGKWLWYRGYGVADTKERADLLEKLAIYGKAGSGWHGLDAADVSQNPLVLKLDARAPYSEIAPLIEAAKKHRLRTIVLGTTQLIGKDLAAKDSPNLKELPEGYIFGEIPQQHTPRDEALPVERVTIHSNFMAGGEKFEFYLAVGARARRQVAGSECRIDEVAPSLSRTDSDGVAKTVEIGLKRSAIVQKLADGVAELIIKAGTKVAVLEISGGDGVLSPPWAAIELGHRAALELNARWAKAGRTELRINLPFEIRPAAEGRIPQEAPDDGKPEGDSVGLGEGNGVGNGTPHAVFGGRADKARRENADHVKAALDWLRDHQEREGKWGATFRAATTRAGAGVTANVEFIKPGNKDADCGWVETTEIGLTGLAIMAFAGSGETHKHGAYKAVVRSAFIHLRSAQQNDGCFGAKEDDHFVYNHAIATIGMAEIYALSGDALLLPMLERAVKFIVTAQNPGLGWRYGVQPAYNDSSVTGWMVLALQTAHWAGVKADYGQAFTDAFKWFEMVTVKVEGRFKTGYDAPGSNNARLRSASDYDNNPTMEAIHGTARALTGRLEGAADQIKDHTVAVGEAAPRWERKELDLYYWLWASMFLRQCADKDWKAWKESCFKVLTDHQRGFHAKDVEAGRTTPLTLDEHGSWDAVDAWGQAGGRVYSTALGALILSTEWRHKRVADLPK